MRGWKLVVSKKHGASDTFTPENKSKTSKAWVHSFKLGPRKSALGNLPPDETQFPACTWLKELLTEGVQPFILNSLLMRKPSPPNQRRGFRTDGSNLPWVVNELRQKNEDAFGTGSATSRRPFRTWSWFIRHCGPRIGTAICRWNIEAVSKFLRGWCPMAHSGFSPSRCRRISPISRAFI